ncbi:hypothetical protein [Fibrella arboris]|uniref:hypothetical protein n=1 Tax=Fibrella arboris TaxID=3242486 RepID=UPI0035208B3E
MNTGVQCPKCRSYQLSGKRKTLRPKKAAEDVIFADGIDTLAQVYRYGGINVQCTDCNYEWDPSERIVEERIRTHQQKLQHEKKWKAAFYKAVEQDDRLEAGRILEQEREYLYQRASVRRAYSILKKEDQSVYVFMATLFAVCICLVAGILFGFAE